MTRLQLRKSGQICPRALSQKKTEKTITHVTVNGQRIDLACGG
jgi:hypothetical protein